jgi:hypothetical protein
MTESFLSSEGELDFFIKSFCDGPIDIAECTVDGAEMPYNKVKFLLASDGVTVDLTQTPYRDEFFFIPFNIGFYVEDGGWLTVGTKDEKGEITKYFKAKIVQGKAG